MKNFLIKFLGGYTIQDLKDTSAHHYKAAYEKYEKYDNLIVNDQLRSKKYKFRIDIEKKLIFPTYRKNIDMVKLYHEIKSAWDHSEFLIKIRFPMTMLYPGAGQMQNGWRIAGKSKKYIVGDFK